MSILCKQTIKKTFSETVFLNEILAPFFINVNLFLADQKLSFSLEEVLDF